MANIQRVIYELIARDKASREMQKVADAATRAAAQVTAAEKAQADAAGRLRVAESKLQEIRDKQAQSDERIRVAETNLNRVRSNSKTSTTEVAKAERELNAARRGAVQASRVVSAEERVAKARRDVEGATSRLSSTERHLASLHDPVIHPRVDTRPADRALNRLQRKISHLSRGRAIIQVAVAAAPLAIPAGAALLGGGAGLATIFGAAGAGALGFGAVGLAALKRAEALQKRARTQAKKINPARKAQKSAQQRLADAEASYSHAQAVAAKRQAASIAEAKQRLAKAQGNLSFARASGIASAERRLEKSVGNLGYAQKSGNASINDRIAAARRRLSTAQSNLAYASKTGNASIASGVAAAQQRLAHAQSSLAYDKAKGYSTRGAQYSVELAQRALQEAQNRTPSLRSRRQSVASAKLALMQAQGESPNLRSRQQSVADARYALKQAQSGSSTLRSRQQSVASAEAALQKAETSKTDMFSHAQSVAKARKNLAEATRRLNNVEAKHNKILNHMTPAQKSVLASLAALKSGWSKFLGSGASAAVLRAMAAGMGLLLSFLKPLGAFLRPVAKGMAALFQSLGGFAQSKQVMKFARDLGKFAQQVLIQMGPALIFLTSGFISLFRAFMPLGRQMLPALVKMTAAFARWSAGLSKSKGFKDFMKYVRQNGPLLMKTLGDLGQALIQLVIALAPLGSAMLRELDKFTRWVDGLAKAHPQIIRFIAVLAVTSTGLSALAQPFTKLIDLAQLIVAPFRLLANKLGLGAKAMKLLKDASIGTRLGLIRMAVAEKASAVASKISEKTTLLYVKATQYLGDAQLKTRAKTIAATVAEKAQTVWTKVVEKTTMLYGKAVEFLGRMQIGTRLKTIAATVATKAWAFAQKAAAVASKVFAIAVRLAGIAVKFALGPIGLIILGLTALAVGLIYAYKHSKTFRDIVNGVWADVKKAAVVVFKWLTGPFVNFFIVTLPKAWHTVWSSRHYAIDAWNAVKDAAKTVVDWFQGPFVRFFTVTLVKMWHTVTGGAVKAYDYLKKKTLDAVTWVVQKFLWFSGQIIHTAAKALGWIPGLGPKLKDAAKKFDVFKDRVNAALRKINSHKTVDIVSKYKIKGKFANQQAAKLWGMNRAADGWTVPKRGGGRYGDYHPALLADGEEVISNRHGEADAYRAQKRAGILHLADGGGAFKIGTSGIGQTTRHVVQWIRQIGKNIDRLDKVVGKKLSAALNRSITSFTVPKGPTPKGPLERVAKVLLARYGWSRQWPAFNAIEMSEAGWNIHATNPSSGAYGLAQALPPSKYASAGADWRTNGVTQLRWMMAYIASRYGNPTNAWRFHLAHNWYAKGTKSALRGWGVVGENGPELEWFNGGERVVPTEQSREMLGSSNVTYKVYATSDKASEIVRALAWREKEASLAGVYRR